MKTILAVDDELRVRQLYRDLFEDEGYEVVDADGADAALASLKSRPIDLAILDFRMPGTHGLELLTTIHRTHPDLPVILCSGLDGLFDSYPVWEAQGQIVGLFRKPASLPALLDCVQNALNDRTTPEAR